MPSFWVACSPMYHHTSALPVLGKPPPAARHRPSHFSNALHIYFIDYWLIFWLSLFLCISRMPIIKRRKVTQNASIISRFRQARWAAPRVLITRRLMFDYLRIPFAGSAHRPLIPSHASPPMQRPRLGLIAHHACWLIIAAPIGALHWVLIDKLFRELPLPYDDIYLH
jgi:hypothetical protein